ncbi:MAG: hypothetical protein ACE5JB_02915 [bacterium]
MNSIIIDSNFLIGLLDDQDIWHSKATNIKTEIQNQKLTIVYFDCVISESLSTIAKRFEGKKRFKEFPKTITKLQNLVSVNEVTWVYPEV